MELCRIGYDRIKKNRRRIGCDRTGSHTLRGGKTGRVEDEGQRRDGLIQQLSRSEREPFGSAASLFCLTTRSAK